MANYVNTHIRFERLSEAGVAKLNELYTRLREGDNDSSFGDLWGIPHEVSDLQEWMYENVGSKWCYIEDYSENHIQLTSAWYYPDAGITWLVKTLGEVDPDVLAYVTYEDEMPNFFGCWFFDRDGIIDGYEWEEEEIQEMMKEYCPAIASLNEEEQSEQYWEMWGDNIWDLASESQYQTYTSIVETLK